MNVAPNNTTEEIDRISFPNLQVDFSENVNYHRVKLPKKVTEHLAEDVGIHISDGCMRLLRTAYMIYSGHMIDDFPYYKHRFIPLLKELWGTKRVGWRRNTRDHTIKVAIYSKELVLFKHRILGLPLGKKVEITIPKYFLNDLRMTKAILRGLFDGDGSITFKSKDGLAHTYPVMSYSSISKALMRQLHKLLREFGFQIPDKLYDKKDGTLILSINGDMNYERWMNTIGFNNPKHLTKVVLYETLGIVPPETDLAERVKLIRGDVKLSEIYPANDLRINENKIIEKKILQKLAHRTSHMSELGREFNVYRQRVKNALRRLSKMRLVECIQAKGGLKAFIELHLGASTNLSEGKQ